MAEKTAGAGGVNRLAAAMKRNKKLEICVYCALCGIALLLFLTGIAGGVKWKSPAIVGRSNTEKQLMRALSGIDGAGEVDVMITYNSNEGKEQEICGVIVIAQGARDVNVRVNLVRAVQTVLGVSRERVEIFQMEGNG